MQFYCTFVLVPGARCCVVMLCCPLPALLCSDTLPAAPSPANSGSFSAFLVVLGARCLLIQRKASTSFFIAALNSSLPRFCCCCCSCCYCCFCIPYPGWELKTKAKQTKTERPYLNSEWQQCVLAHIHTSIRILNMYIAHIAP